MIRNKIKAFYYTRIKRLSEVEYSIMLMRRSGITIGDNCRIFTHIRSNEPTLISIGNNVTISSDVKFCTHDNGIIKAIPGKTDVVGKITIGNNCFIGMNSLLMLGVELGDRCIVGGGVWLPIVFLTIVLLLVIRPERFVLQKNMHANI